MCGAFTINYVQEICFLSKQHWLGLAKLDAGVWYLQLFVCDKIDWCGMIDFIGCIAFASI